MASRGVGILISKKLNFTVPEKHLDVTGNIIVINLVIDGWALTVGSVYGPNDNDLEFFNTLEQFVKTIGNESVVLGGDWNLTMDPRAPVDNLDVVNMANIPSRQRSMAANKMCDALDLEDAYRILNPNAREFTYVPNAAANINRSRIDFFLISSSLAVQKYATGISHGLVSKSFDHNRITLEFGLKKPKTLTKSMIR
jgi:exonuclease III